jgi:hypothetical protein
MLEDALKQLQCICIHVTVNVEIKINVRCGAKGAFVSAKY